MSIFKPTWNLGSLSTVTGDVISMNANAHTDLISTDIVTQIEFPSSFQTCQLFFYANGTYLKIPPVTVTESPYTLQIPDGVNQIRIMTGRRPPKKYKLRNVTRELNSFFTIKGKAPTGLVELDFKVDKTSIYPGESITYTAYLTASLAFDLNVVSIINGNDVSLRIPSGELHATSTYAPNGVSSVRASIKFTGSAEVANVSSTQITTIQSTKTSTVSVQSGDWTEASTWIDGVIPTPTMEVTVLGSHKVFLSMGVERLAKTIIQGELEVAEGATLSVGNASKIAGELLLDGGTLSGLGTVDHKFGIFHSTGTNWSTVSVAAITSTTFIRNGFHSWDCTRVTFKKGSYTFTRTPLQVSGKYSTWSFVDCVFKDTQSLNLMKAGHVTAPEPVTMKRCTFWDVFGFKIGSVNHLTLDTCVFYSNTIRGTTFNGIFINSAKVAIKKCVFVNITQTGTNKNCTIEDCFYTYTLPYNGGAFSGTSSSIGRFDNNYVYANEESSNTRALNHPKATGCVVEERSSGGSNSFYSQQSTIEWHNNFLLCSAESSSDGITTMPNTNDLVVNYNIKNNTIINNTSFTSERYYLNEASVFKISNNLHVLKDATVARSLFHKTINGLPRLSVEYKNNYSSAETWLQNTITSMGDFDSNVKEVDNKYPAFVDPTRTIEKWAAENIGGVNYKNVVLHFLTLNGYDNTTERHSATQLPENTIIDFINWYKEGYTPTNMDLATAGEGGTYVGAMEPKAVQSGLKVVFNGVSMARAFFNGEEIPLDKVKSFLG